MPLEPLRVFRLGRSLVLGLAMAAVHTPVSAQDTPEMLAAMQAHLPLVPATVPDRDALPSEVRAELPLVVVETHRWHAEPAQRFVILQGRRIEEGGVVDRELWLREIRAEGVVLQFRDVFFFQTR